MSLLIDYHRRLGASIAPDGIPLHYGDMVGEYQAGLQAALLLDRSHEGRLQLSGAGAASVVHRISSNHIEALEAGQGAPTLFLNANGRILERAIAYREAASLRLITAPAHANALRDYLQRNIFFNDDAHVTDISEATRQFALHGPHADAIISSFFAEASTLAAFAHRQLALDGLSLHIARNKALSGTHWCIFVPLAQAAEAHAWLLERGAAHGLKPGGSLVYNALRIRSGLPAGRELSEDYLPLEVGLWDEVSFHKGCYTGQEIIARMESRAKLARTLVHLDMTQHIEAPAPVLQDKHIIGTLTSSVLAPDGTLHALAIIKTAYARPGTQVFVADGQTQATVRALAGAQPAFLEADPETT